jgi:hypothetical protein
MNKGVVSIVATLTCTAAGCAQNQDRPAQTLATGVVEETSSTLIASVELEPGHVVRFYDAEPGPITTESGEIERDSPLLAHREIDSSVEVFKAVAPGQPVPPALLAADARQRALRAQASSSPIPADGLLSKGDGPSFYTTGEQTWFRQTFCPFGTPKCIQGWDWIESGWDHTTDWTTTAMVGSEGGLAAPHTAFWWKCSGSSCSWEPLLSASISPGHYHQVGYGGGPFYFRSTLTGAGGGTQVSMAIADGPYDCVHCNDGSCQCGYNIPDNLCAGRGGPDFSVGCIVQQ